MKKREQDAVTYLWRDRRRVLGMPITFTRYALSEDRLFVERGLLTTHLEEVLLYRVRDIGLTISLGQRIFGVGSVIIESSDASSPKLVLSNVKAPRQVKEQIHRQVEEMKIARQMRLGELLGDPDPCGCQEEPDGLP